MMDDREGDAGGGDTGARSGLAEIDQHFDDGGAEENRHRGLEPDDEVDDEDQHQDKHQDQHQDQDRDDDLGKQDSAVDDARNVSGTAGGDHSVHFDVSVDEHGGSRNPATATGTSANASAAVGDEYFSSSSSNRSRGQIFTESGFSSSSSSFMTGAPRSSAATGTTGGGPHTGRSDGRTNNHRVYQERFMQMLKEQQRRAAEGRAAGDGSGSYDDLLSQFGALSKDLAKVVARSQKVEDSNAELHEAYDRLKDQHLKLLERYRDARKMANAEAETRRRIEHRQDEIVQGLARQLEVKAEEFAELQIQLSLPRDVNIIRQKVQRELEGAHRAQVYSRDREIEKLRASLAKEHNAHELLKTEFEQYTLNQKEEREVLRAEHRAATEELGAQLSRLRREAEETSKQEQVRLRALDVAQIRAERDGLREQLVVTRADLESARISADQLATAEDRARLELGTEVKELRLENTRFRRQQEHHEGERRRLEDALEKANAARVEQQAENSKLESKLAGAGKALDEERARGSRALSEASTKAERERHELRAQVESLEAQLTRVAARHSDQDKLREGQHSSALAEIERARDRALATLEDEKRARRDLDEEIVELRARVESQAREFAEARDRLSEQRDLQASEARRAVKEKEALHERVKVLAVKLEQVETRANELEDEYRDLQDKHRTALENAREAKERTQRAESRLSALDQELRIELEKQARLRAALAESSQRAEDETHVARDKENDVKQRLAETLVAQSQKGRRALDKLEKKHAAYHEALSKCKDRIKDLRAKYHASQREVSALLAARERLQQRLKDLERYRDLYFNMRSHHIVDVDIDDDGHQHHDDDNADVEARRGPLDDDFLAGPIAELDTLGAILKTFKTALRDAAKEETDEDASSQKHGQDKNFRKTQKRKLAVAELGTRFEKAATMAKLRANNKNMHAALGKLGKALDKILSPEDVEIFRHAAKNDNIEETTLFDLFTLAIVDHYMHCGRFDLAREVAAEIDQEIDQVRAEQFQEIHSIMSTLGGDTTGNLPDEALSQNMPKSKTDVASVDITKALAWSLKHAKKLSQQSSPGLLFELHKLHFLQLVASEDPGAAVEYARQELYPLSRQLHGGNVAVTALMGKLAIPLEHNAVAAQQSVVREIFRAEASFVYGIPAESPLVVALQAGRLCIRKLRKYFRVILARRAASAAASAAADDSMSSSATTNPLMDRIAEVAAAHRAARARRSSFADSAPRRPSTAVSLARTGAPAPDGDAVGSASKPWADLEQLPVNVDLDTRYDFHSVIICPVSKEQTSKDNEPMLLSCGHVIAKASMKCIIKPGAGRLKCPTCQVDQSAYSAMRLYV
ncbi:Protein RMD5-like A [Hondaea fermentalgiana]|uniref:Protein RMD5-like A n=1 Tax=Hondaea fermentalgiana TaxID=2315210 RepID=A0A2R5G7N0_9STRA|nr:Protein RMD5-like A [Hondaea fermentalgiana]|eukprot:GBG27047.1 Protein RMD5-like A [Hondaea fermentalgiana]